MQPFTEILFLCLSLFLNLFQTHNQFATLHFLVININTAEFISNSKKEKEMPKQIYMDWSVGIPTTKLQIYQTFIYVHIPFH